MANQILGGSSIDGFLEHPVTWSNWEAKLGRNIFATNKAAKALYSYIIEESDSGAGNLLANGYYANPTELQVVIAEAANALALNGKATATTAEAVAGTAAKIPDVIGVKAAVDNQFVSRARGRTLTLLMDGDDTLLDTGDYYWESDAGSTNHPDGKTGQWYINHDKRVLAGGEVQHWTPEDPLFGVAFYRTRGTLAWSSPIYKYDTNNLINAQNVSGATVTSNSAVSGANLSPAKAGTWRNVSGNDILNNGYGLWQLA